MNTFSGLKTTMICCLALAAQAHDNGRQNRRPRQNHQNGAPRQGNGHATGGGAGGDWRAAWEGQVGPDEENPNRGVGRPIADGNVLRRGIVLSGTNESWDAPGIMWGSAQILPDPLRTGETRPCFAWWNDEQCDNNGIEWLHPLLQGLPVEFVVVKGGKNHQVKAILVNHIGVDDLPIGTPQEERNRVANQRHLSRNVPAAASPNYNVDRLNQLYMKIGIMTQKLFDERNPNERKPVPDLIFADKSKQLMRQVAEQDMEEKEVEAALMQLVEELLRRNSGTNSPASSQRSGGSAGRRPSASSSTPAQPSVRFAESPKEDAHRGRNTKKPKAPQHQQPDVAPATPEPAQPKDAEDITARVRAALAKSKPSAQPKAEPKARVSGINFAPEVEQFNFVEEASAGASSPGGSSPSGLGSPAPELSEDALTAHQRSIAELDQAMQRPQDDAASDKSSQD